MLCFILKKYKIRHHVCVTLPELVNNIISVSFKTNITLVYAFEMCLVFREDGVADLI